MLQEVRQTIEDYGMLTPGQPVLVALSGGADSTALLRVLLLLGYEVRAFHLNHLLRGEQSMRDEHFCRALCQAHSVPLRVMREDVAACARMIGEGIEVTARKMRYQMLQECAADAKIATAHTADDNLETMVFHLARGTGMRGLAGIPPVRDNIVRPMLAVSRARVEKFLAGLHQPFVVDSTNFSGENMRSRLRQSVMGGLKQINPKAAEAAAGLAVRLREDEACLEGQAIALLSGGNQASLPLLQGAHRAIRTRALRLLCERAGVPMGELTAAHTAAMEQLLQAENPSARISLPEGYVALREYDKLRVEKWQPAEEGEPERALSIPFEGAIFGGEIWLSLRQTEKNEILQKNYNTFYVDCGTIEKSTLCVRTRREGDRMQISTAGSRSLKRLMIDRRVPRALRDRLLVFADRFGVIAVEGLGVSLERLPQSGTILQIRIERVEQHGL